MFKPDFRFRRQLALVGFLAAALIFPATATSQAPTELVEGEILEGWQVTDIRRHPEFIRYVFQPPEGSADAATIIEVRYAGDQVGPTVSENYLVQPAPDQAPPDELLQAVWTRFEALDNAGHQPIVEVTGVGSAGRDTGVESESRTRTTALVILGVLALLGVIRLLMRLKGGLSKSDSESSEPDAETTKAPSDEDEASE